jgi:hypothetical protein
MAAVLGSRGAGARHRMSGKDGRLWSARPNSDRRKGCGIVEKWVDDEYSFDLLAGLQIFG